MHKLIQENSHHLYEICRRHFVKKLYVFGSFARGDSRSESDIDFLYEIDRDRFQDWAMGEYDYTDNIFSLEGGLMRLFKRKVDLVPEAYVQNKYMRKTIDESKQIVYAA